MCLALMWEPPDWVHCLNCHTKEMLFPRRRLQYQVVPCNWTSKSTHPSPRHRTDSALRFPSLLPPRQPPPCPQNPRGAEGVASLPPRRQRETSHGASGKLLPFGIGGCIHHGCNILTFSCWDVFHAHSRVLPLWRSWRTPRGYNVSAAPPHHALCKLRCLVAPCIIQTPPFTIVGGRVEKMSFFQIVHMTKVSTQIHSSISQYDVYKVSSKKLTIT
jgi:hypothetical protein